MRRVRRLHRTSADVKISRGAELPRLRAEGAAGLSDRTGGRQHEHSKQEGARHKRKGRSRAAIVPRVKSWSRMQLLQIAPKDVRRRGGEGFSEAAALDDKPLTS
jgi:hypothetical protein